MNTDDLIRQVRLNTTTEDNDLDYTSAVLLSELSDSLTTKFQQMVLEADSGYWLQREVYTVTAGQESIRIPYRAIGLSKVEYTIPGGSSYRRLKQTTEGHSDLFETPAAYRAQPQAWVLRGDLITFLPLPDQTYSVRVSYFLRPSELVATQLGNLGSGATRGLVQAVNPTARTITVNQIPFDMLLATPAVITSGLTLVDVVHPNGWHDLSLVNAIQVYTGTTITVLGTQTLANIQVGDYVRAAEQTDWPQIPDDYHRCLADITSSKVLIQQDYQQKAAGFASDVSADLARFSKLIANRVEEEPITVRADLPSLRRRW